MRIGAAIGALMLVSAGAAAQNYDPGVSDLEVKLGQSVPYSGPASAYAIIARTQIAYFKKISDEGGLNGRKVDLISLDDSYLPPKTVEATRRLVEQERVLAIFGTIGAGPNAAIQSYLNSHKVPQILYTGGSRFSDPAKYPWSLSIYPSYVLEGSVFGRYVLATKPDAKIGVLYQNDDSGRDYLAGFKQGLGERARSMIASEESYATSDPTISSQLVQLRAAGADVVFDASTPRFAAQAIKGIADLNWKPLHLITSPSSSIPSVIEPAGPANAVGVVTAAFLKTADDPRWTNDSDVQEYEAFVKVYMPGAQASDFNVTVGYATAAIMAQLIDKAGRNLSRQSLLAAATSIPPTTFPMLLPGLTISISPTKYDAFNSVRLQRFDGSKYVLLDGPF